MPFAGPFILLTVQGVFGSAGSPVEIWRTTLKGAVSTTWVYDQGVLQSWLSDIATPVAAFHAGDISAASQTLLTALTAAHVGPDGKYTGGGTQTTTVHTYASPVAGTGSANKPLSSALCLTLRTALARGRASHGRMYWPACAIPLANPTMTVADNIRTSIVNQARTMLEAINDAAVANELGGFEGRWASVMSNLGAGTTQLVRRVEVGARLDSQERREASLPEAYIGADLT